MIKINSSKLRNTTKVKITSGKSNLSKARSALTGIKMPKDFSYANQLKNIPSQIEQIEKELDGINTYIEKKISEFEGAQKGIKGLNWAPSYMQGTNFNKSNSDPLNWSLSYQGGLSHNNIYDGYGLLITNPQKAKEQTINIIKRTGATGANYFLSLLRGVGNAGESLIHCAGMLAVYPLSLITIGQDIGQFVKDGKNLRNVDDFINSMKNTRDLWIGANSFLFEKSIVNSTFDNFYHNNKFGKWIDTNAYTPIESFVSKIGEDLLNLKENIPRYYDETMTKLENNYSEKTLLQKALELDLSDLDKIGSEKRKILWTLSSILNWEENKKNSRIMISDELKRYGIDIKPWNIKQIHELGKEGIFSDYYYIDLYDGTIIFYAKYYSEIEGDIGYKITVDYGDGIAFKYDLANNIRSIRVNDKLYEYPFGQEKYGGNQCSFRNNNAYLCQDEKIQEIVRSYWPNATDEDIELLLYKVSSTGCGYTAMVNTLFEEYKEKRRAFKKKFGFPMYIENKQGERDYNYEYIILDYYCYIWNKYSEYGLDEITEGVKEENSNDAALTGKKAGIDTGSTSVTYELFENYLKEKYEIDVSVSKNSNYLMEMIDKVNKNNYLTTYEGLKNTSIDNNIVISASGWDLYTTEQELYYVDGGGHAMSVLGISDDGKRLKVSSWGEEYWLDLSNQDDEDYTFFTVVDYN